MTDNQDGREKVVELVSNAQSALLVTTTPQGDLVSRPMAVQQADFDGDLWFFTDEGSDKIRHVQANPKVNVSFSDDKKSEWMSITGTAEVVHDPAKAQSLWSKPLEAWFPDGLQTPGLTLLQVHAEQAEFWDAATSKVRQLLGVARAIRKDEPDEFPLDNRSVDLA